MIDCSSHPVLVPHVAACLFLNGNFLFLLSNKWLNGCHNQSFLSLSPLLFFIYVVILQDSQTRLCLCKNTRDVAFGMPTRISSRRKDFMRWKRSIRCCYSIDWRLGYSNQICSPWKLHFRSRGVWWRIFHLIDPTAFGGLVPAFYTNSVHLTDRAVTASFHVKLLGDRLIAVHCCLMTSKGKQGRWSFADWITDTVGDVIRGCRCCPQHNLSLACWIGIGLSFLRRSILSTNSFFVLCFVSGCLFYECSVNWMEDMGTDAFVPTFQWRYYWLFVFTHSWRWCRKNQ